MHAPTTSHLQATKRILRYLKGSLGLGLQLKAGPTSNLSAFSDADWAACPDDRRSTTAYSVFLGTHLLSWGTKKEATVSRSSAEAEYKALAVTASELLWLSYVLCDLGLRFSLPSLLYCDNISATHMAVNPVFHARTKDVEIDYHFVREKVARGDLKVLYVRTDKTD